MNLFWEAANDANPALGYALRVGGGSKLLSLVPDSIVTGLWKAKCLGQEQVVKGKDLAEAKCAALDWMCTLMSGLHTQILREIAKCS